MTRLKLIWISILIFSTWCNAQTITEQSILGNWKYDKLKLDAKDESKRDIFESRMKNVEITLKENYEYTFKLGRAEESGKWYIKSDSVVLITTTNRELALYVPSNEENTMEMWMSTMSKSSVVVFKNIPPVDPELLKQKQLELEKKKQADLDMMAKTVKIKDKKLLKTWYTNKVIIPKDETKTTFVNDFMLDSEFTFNKDNQLTISIINGDTTHNHWTWILHDKTEIHLTKGEKKEIFRINQMSEHELIITDIKAEMTYYLKDTKS